MATRTATKRAPRKAAPKPPPVVEPELDEEDEDLEEDDTELEDLEEDEVEDEAPKARKSTQPEVGFGVSDLVKYIQKKYPNRKEAQKLDPRGLRNLIRKMARDGKGRVDREIVAGNRTRYDWGSPNNPEVKAIIKALLGGELEADKKEKLDALKQRNAAKKQAAEKLAGPKKRAKAKPAVVEADEDDEELEIDEDEE